MTFSNLILSLKGSSSSGNYGHAGIPGHYGGSAPNGGGSSGGSAAPDSSKPTSSDKAIAAEPTTPPRKVSTNVEHDKDKDGVTDAARVGVPALEVPPPPGISQLPNLTEHERAVESNFIKAFEDDPDGMAKNFLDVVKKSGDPPTFGTDDAKALTNAWSDPSPEQRAINRATLNTPLHQTANAIAKRAFVEHLDTLKPGDELMVTVGGCGAGKGFALASVPDAKAVKDNSKAVWDSAGDQNATENPWIQKEAEKRGLKVTYVYVHADPKTQWADPSRGVVKRAADPKDGRMVDAKVFADSYAIGATNHQAFYQSNKNNPNAKFIFLDNTSKPKQLPGIPKEALNINRKDLAKYAADVVEKADVPPYVKRGASMGARIWGDD
jgi:hypothetical protein